MHTKKCSKCGWVYPGTWPKRICKFCHTYLNSGYCSVCGEWTDNLRDGATSCRKCETIQHIRWRNKHRNISQERLEEWQSKISAASTKALTEEDWLAACQHFKGCAYCGSQEIEARSMFIPFKYGGKYCAWNIVPACEKCETAIKTELNPFLRMDRMLQRSKASQANKLGYTLENLQGIVDYLQTKLEDSTSGQG